MKIKEKSCVVTLDISGSMGSRMEGVREGNKTYMAKRTEYFKKVYEEKGEEMPAQIVSADNTLLITTLAAVDENVTRIAKEEPNTKMGIVLFEENVFIVGDCTQPMLPVPKITFNSPDALKKWVNENASHMIQEPISKSEQKMHETIYNINTAGTTALGPAAMTSISLSGKHKLGSNVVICTDGSAN